MRPMEPRDLALAHARGRMLIGAAFVLAPGLAGRLWIGGDARRRSVKVLARAFGVRDLALGLGVVIALDRGAPVRGWIEGGVVSDTVDVSATLVAGDSIPANVRRGALALGAGSVLLGAALARALDQPVAPAEVQAPEAALTGHHRAEVS
jgi:hypothetical protein